MSTLNNITTQIDSIKTDIVTSHTNLKNALIEKGVEVLPTDKMSNLIDLVEDIITQQKTTIGDNITIYNQVSKTYSIVAPYTSPYTDTVKYEALFVNGAIRIKNKWSNNGIKEVSFILLDSNDSIIEQKTFTHSAASVDYVVEFNNLIGHRKILVRVTPKTSAITATCDSFSITCDLV